jgi:hypothetical protein
MLALQPWQVTFRISDEGESLDRILIERSKTAEIGKVTHKSVFPNGAPTDPRPCLRDLVAARQAQGSKLMFPLLKSTSISHQCDCIGVAIGLSAGDSGSHSWRRTGVGLPMKGDLSERMWADRRVGGAAFACHAGERETGRRRR